MSGKKKKNKCDGNGLGLKMTDLELNDEQNKLKEEYKQNKLLWVMTEHVGPFKILIEVLKELLPEAILEFHQNLNNNNTEIDKEGNTASSSDEEEDNKKEKNKTGGMRIMAIDSTRTVLIYLKLDSINFTEYFCNKDKLTLGVNMSYFHKLIKSMEKDDTLSLFVDKEDINHLGIRIENPEKRSITNFKMNLMDLDEDELTIPPTVFQSRIVISSSEFHKICREMHGIAEYVEIKCANDQLMFTCKGDYAERETVLRESEDGINVTYNTEELQIVQGIYELKHLVLFGKCTTLCNDIEIYMKNNYPLVIKYTVATLGRLLLCLTPIRRKNNDDEDEDEDEDDEDEF
jgi:proliferating cell nuclear antigen